MMPLIVIAEALRLAHLVVVVVVALIMVEHGVAMAVVAE
jgi:hypothetical protein